MVSRPPPAGGPPSIYAGRHAPPPPRPVRWRLRIGLTVGLLAVLGIGAFAAKWRFLPSDAVLPGLMIDGEQASSSSSSSSATPETVRALTEDHAKKLLARKIALVLPNHDTPILEATLEELGLRVDVDRTTAVALRMGKDGDLITRGETAQNARDGKLDVPLFIRLDREVTLTKLSALKEVEDISPVSARLDLDKHETIPEKDGQYIDADETASLIERAAGSGSEPRAKNEIEIGAGKLEKITLPMKTFAPRVSSAFLKSLDIATVVAEYETYFSRGGDQQKRGKNIDNASQKLDGIVISPGELLSFNEIIGERSESNGFEKSWEIFKGEMVEGVGGGTCQVASTFHAATFFAGFDVLERLPHSRPSAYIPMGLDSTVVFPAVDLKVRNPHPFPVVVHAKTIGNKLRVELLGKMRPVHVGFEREVVSTLPYKRKIEEDSALSGKKVLVKQHGIKGYKIKRKRHFTYPDGTHKKEELTDTYPPTTEIYKVPVGFDIALLPPLPEGNGEDADLGGNPSATPASARAPSGQGTDATATASTPQTAPTTDVEFVNAPGAHTPTAAQREPPKTIWLKR